MFILSHIVHRKEESKWMSCIMNIKRAIIIKSPILRKVRNNFREVIFRACSARLKKIHEKKQELGLNRNSYEDNEYGKLSSELSRQSRAIENPLHASILLCPVCFQGDKDMIFNPIRKKWYCTECYGILQNYKGDGEISVEFP